MPQSGAELWICVEKEEIFEQVDHTGEMPSVVGIKNANHVALSSECIYNPATLEE